MNCDSIPKVKAGWETVHHQDKNGIERFRIEEGWLYIVTAMNDGKQERYMTFVPSENKKDPMRGDK